MFSQYLMYFCTSMWKLLGSSQRGGGLLMCKLLVLEVLRIFGAQHIFGTTICY